MAIVQNFSWYYDIKTNQCDSASYFGRGVCPANPDRYVFLGTWQPSQASTLPFVENGKVYRWLYGKKVEQVSLTERLSKVIKNNND